MRYLKTFAILTVLLMLLLISGRVYLSYFLQQELKNRTFSWQEKKESVLGINFYNVTGPNMRMSRVHIPFYYPPTITIFEPKIYWNDNTTPCAPLVPPSSTNFCHAFLNPSLSGPGRPASPTLIPI